MALCRFSPAFQLLIRLVNYDVVITVANNLLMMLHIVNSQVRYSPWRLNTLVAVVPAPLATLVWPEKKLSDTTNIHCGQNQTAK